MILKECCKPIKREHFSGNYLRKNRRKETLVCAMLEHYEMTEGQAEKDVETFTSQLIEAGILEA